MYKYEPNAPHTYGQIKYHKKPQNNTPILNCKDNPGYKLATFSASLLKFIIQVPSTFNIRYSTNLIILHYITFITLLTSI
jgi:hypothetical protein